VLTPSPTCQGSSGPPSLSKTAVGPYFILPPHVYFTFGCPRNVGGPSFLIRMDGNPPSLLANSSSRSYAFFMLTISLSHLKFSFPAFNWDVVRLELFSRLCPPISSLFLQTEHVMGSVTLSLRQKAFGRDSLESSLVPHTPSIQTISSGT